MPTVELPDTTAVLVTERSTVQLPVPLLGAAALPSEYIALIV